LTDGEGEARGFWYNAAAVTAPTPPALPIRITFAAGTLRLEVLPKEHGVALPAGARWDEREEVHRLPAIDYAELILSCGRRALCTPTKRVCTPSSPVPRP
jgi:hypothetical protein